MDEMAKKQNKPEKNEEQQEQILQDPMAEKIEELTQKVEAQEDSYKRMLAEYDNYRKRTARERESLYSDAKADVIASFLAVVDNLERAIAQESTDLEYKKGIDLIFKQFMELMEKHNVKPLAQAGETFDPNIHNAVMHVEDENFGENQIAEVLQKGYIMGEKVIRHAMVKVAN